MGARWRGVPPVAVIGVVVVVVPIEPMAALTTVEAGG
jgi:hypothetical protein